MQLSKMHVLMNMNYGYVVLNVFIIQCRKEMVFWPGLQNLVAVGHDENISKYKGRRRWVFKL